MGAAPENKVAKHRGLETILSRWLMPAATTLTVVLFLALIWQAWDLSEYLASTVILVVVPPERIVGVAWGVSLWLARAQVLSTLRWWWPLYGATLLLSIWMVWSAPAFELGTRLYLKMHRTRLAAVAHASREANMPTGAHKVLGESVLIDSDCRHAVAVAGRRIGFVWSAYFVNSQVGPLDATGSSEFAGLTVAVCETLAPNWYYVALLK